MKTVTLVLVTSLFPAAALADAPVGVEAKAQDKQNTINVSPLGVLVGDYALTYERLFGSHGLIVEGIGSRSSGDAGSSLQFGGGVGYRWHWRGRQNSGFLGVMAAQRIGSGTVTDTSGMEHGMSVRSTTVTANIGKRWALTPAVNVTFRIGAGWGHHVATAKGDSMEAKQAEKLMNDILSFLPIGLDGELSVGYAF